MDLSGLKERRLHARWWTLAFISGGFFAVFEFGFFLSQNGNYRFAGISALVAGAFFGLIMGPFAVRANARQLAARGAVPAGRGPDVQRAVSRGPVPEEPEIREPAERALTFQLGQLERMRIWGTVTFGLLGALALHIAVTQSPWWLLGVLVFVGFLAYQVWARKHLSHRSQMFAAAETERDQDGTTVGSL